MFTVPFAEWVDQQNGKATWHIYTNNILKEARKFIEEMNSPHIIIKEGLSYDELPEILKKYDVGVILYNGHIPNYVYNAPNKLFEYLVCGLDVWYPGVMTEIRGYRTFNTFPKVVEVNFNNLDCFNLGSALNKEEVGKNCAPFLL